MKRIILALMLVGSIFSATDSQAVDRGMSAKQLVQASVYIVCGIAAYKIGQEASDFCFSSEFYAKDGKTSAAAASMLNGLRVVAGISAFGLGVLGLVWSVDQALIVRNT